MGLGGQNPKEREHKQGQTNMRHDKREKKKPRVKQKRGGGKVGKKMRRQESKEKQNKRKWDEREKEKGNEERRGKGKEWREERKKV